MGLEHMCGHLHLPQFDIMDLAVKNPKTATFAVSMVSLYIIYKILTYRKRYSVKDKIVLITGASSGIGKACAEIFHKSGAKVILASRTLSNLNSVKDELQKSNRSLHEPDVVQIDISDYDSIRRAAQSVLQKYGHIDILINNAGQTFRGTCIDTDIAVHEHLMKVNYFGHIVLTQQFLPAMIQNGGGDIVCVSSIQGKLYVPYRAPYCASKHALECYFDCLRAEHAHENINVFICSPGYVKTALSLKAMTADGKEYGKLDANQGSGVEPEYLAQKILQGVERREKHLLVAPFHFVLLCYMRNVTWNLVAWIMKDKARKDRKNYKKSD